jgi:hypothetical protein
MDDQPYQPVLPGYEALTAPNPDGAVFAADLTGDSSPARDPAGAAAANPPFAIENPQSSNALAAYSALLRAQPDLIPELIGGATLAEVEASAAQARAAYTAAREQVLRGAQGPVPPAQAGTTPGPLAAARGFAAIAAGVRAGTRQ